MTKYVIYFCDDTPERVAADYVEFEGGVAAFYDETDQPADEKFVAAFSSWKKVKPR